MEGVHINRPMKQTEMRIREFDESVTEREIVALAKKGGCNPSNVIVSKIRVANRDLGVCD